MDFEDDIAHISSLIILILESAGSLTELGLFVRNKNLKSKLLIFASDFHYHQESFIRLGPLRHLESLNDACVCAYPWKSDRVDETLKDYLPDMRDNVVAYLNELDKTEKFSSENNGHVAFLIYEFVNIFQALKLKEITSYLNILGVPNSQEKTKRLIFLLKKFKLIDSTKLGHIDFYYPLKNQNRINFAGSIDKTAIKIETAAYYRKNSAESIRSKVIREKLGGVK